jgi:molybdate transport system ATP-binding protein
MSLDVDIDHEEGPFRLRGSFRSDGRLTALFGRSGSGKTTLVNAIAGLIRPSQGRIAVDGATLLDTETGLFVPKHRRRIGYVFQEGRLFPHLSVRRNLLFGRWFAGRGGDPDGGIDLDAVVALLGIGHLLRRRPAGLSGGEKQRVAIGRALLARPRLLLMDEPLASLDEARKAEILPFIERLRDEAAVPIVYVSHAVSEVARLATTVVVLENGRVAAVGAAADVLGRLDLPSLHEDDGGAVLEATVEGHDDVYGLSILATPAGPLQVPRLHLPPGAAARAHVRARDVVLSLSPPEGLSALNVLPARVAEIGGADPQCPATVAVRLDCGGATLVARITRKSLDGLDLAPGKAVHAIVKGVSFDEGARRPLPRGGETAAAAPNGGRARPADGPQAAIPNRRSV